MIRLLASRKLKELCSLASAFSKPALPSMQHFASLLTRPVMQKPAAPLSRVMSTSAGPQRMEFKAETKKLLDIVAKSIYTESEVFLRELLSNCSDALEKQKYKELKGELPHSDEPLHISIVTNEKERTLTIIDSGIGMTKDDLVKNLGTIAYSGSSKFLAELNKSGSKAQLDSLIGQFGVGFYSTFIVAEYVEVISKTANSKPTKWVSDGSGSFEVEELPESDFKRGTQITLKLKPNFRQFSKERDVENIIKKYSLFISHPIKLNGDLINNLQAIWYRSKRDISNDEYQRFFEHVTGTKLPYKYILHYSSDVPLTIKALLYIPATHTEKLGMGQEPCQVSLYSRKVLIKSKMSELLPRYLRFVKGVVDCEDIPLNISRETYQGSAHIEKLKATLTKRVIKMLEDEMKRDINSYMSWYQDFSMYLKEGLVTDKENNEAILRLIRFQSSFSDKTVSLDSYLEKAPKDQKCIYFLFASRKETAMASPYMEPFKAAGVPVIFTEHHLDEMFLRNIGKYKDYTLVNIESDFESVLKDLEKKYPDKLLKKKAEAIPEEDITPFCLWAKNELGNDVTKVTASKRPSDSPGVILGQMSTSMRQIMALIDPENGLTKQKEMQIELNITHPLIKRLNQLRKTDVALGGLLIKSLLDYMMVASSIPIDFVSASKRNIEIISKAAELRLDGNKVSEKEQKNKRGRQSVLNEAKGMIKDQEKGKVEFIVNEKGEPVPKK